jgi:hypothetical protein
MNSRKNRIRNAIISIIIGGLIVFFLLSNVEPREIPKAIGNISIKSLIIGFTLYASSVFLKAFRFRMILRTGISMKHLFPIVSLYMFFSNILPMRTGELSYVYLLKKRMRMPGTKSFTSLLVAGVADILVILIAMSIVGWHLRDAFIEGFSRFTYALRQRSDIYAKWVIDNIQLIIIPVLLILVGFVILLLFKKRASYTESRFRRFINILKMKLMEVAHEISKVYLDAHLIGIIVSSILIIAFRFATQWYLVKAMDIPIDIWKLSFALLFGVLFSLVPIHGPAGFGTVEAPWVASLMLLNIPRQDAITSGFGLHIVIIAYCIILGLYGLLSLKVMQTDKAHLVSVTRAKNV